MSKTSAGIGPFSSSRGSPSSNHPSPFRFSPFCPPQLSPAVASTHRDCQVFTGNFPGADFSASTDVTPIIFHRCRCDEHLRTFDARPLLLAKRVHISNSAHQRTLSKVSRCRCSSARSPEKFIESLTCLEAQPCAKIEVRRQSLIRYPRARIRQRQRERAKWSGRWRAAFLPRKLIVKSHGDSANKR